MQPLEDFEPGEFVPVEAVGGIAFCTESARGVYRRTGALVEVNCTVYVRPAKDSTPATTEGA